jgi:hypothetical protein
VNQCASHLTGSLTGLVFETMLNTGVLPFSKGRALQSGKNAEPLIFSGQRVYVCGSRGRGGLTTPWRGLAWPAPPGGVGPSWPPSVSYSGSVGLLVKYDFCSIFQDFS